METGRRGSSGRGVERASAESGADKTGCRGMDQYDSGADAEDHPVPDFRGNDMGAGSYTHGARGDWRQCSNGICKIYERSVSYFVYFVFFVFKVLSCIMKLKAYSWQLQRTRLQER